MIQKLTLHLSQSLAEEISNLMDEAGVLAVTLESHTDEELFEPPLNTTPFWQQTTLHALFETDTDLSNLLSAITQILQPESLDYQITTLADQDQDWQKNFMDTVSPICFANKLWIYPSWHTLPDDGKPAVLLDPGLAFGTGSHPTTQLCLEWLANEIIGGEDVIDYGCGSGILALAALKLGARKAWAIDNDPQAIEATLENAKRNQITDNTIEAFTPETLPADLYVDILVANILANPLIALAPHFARLVKPGGKIVLAGILTEQVENIIQAYTSWFNFSQQVGETWVCLVGGRK